MDLDAIFKAYDVRGIYPDQLDEEVAHRVGRALVELPGAMFTASHNPATYNGIKLCRPAAVPIGEDTGLLDIKGMVAANAFPRGKRAGSVERTDVMLDYVDHLLALVDVSTFGGLTVAVDAANGMGGLTVPAVF